MQISLFVSELIGQEGRLSGSHHPRHQTQDPAQVQCRRENPGRGRRTARRAEYCGALSTGGDRREPVLQLEQGVHGSRQGSPGWEHETTSQQQVWCNGPERHPRGSACAGGRGVLPADGAALDRAGAAVSGGTATGGARERMTAVVWEHPARRQKRRPRRDEIFEWVCRYADEMDGPTVLFYNLSTSPCSITSRPSAGALAASGANPGELLPE
jgi:hypothetical protein